MRSVKSGRNYHLSTQNAILVKAFSKVNRFGWGKEVLVLTAFIVFWWWRWPSAVRSILDVKLADMGMIGHGRADITFRYARARSGTGNRRSEG